MSARGGRGSAQGAEKYWKRLVKSKWGMGSTVTLTEGKSYESIMPVY